jgi:hypothetical protein
MLAVVSQLDMNMFSVQHRQKGFSTFTLNLFSGQRLASQLIFSGRLLKLLRVIWDYGFMNTLRCLSVLKEHKRFGNWISFRLQMKICEGAHAVWFIKRSQYKSVYSFISPKCSSGQNSLELTRRNYVSKSRPPSSRK